MKIKLNVNISYIFKAKSIPSNILLIIFNLDAEQNNEYNSFYNVFFKVLSGEMNILLVYNDVCVFCVCVLCH